MAINIDESVKRSQFENRLASGYVDGVRITAQARVGDPKFNGDPYVVAGSAGNDDYERFNTVDEMLDRFEELKDEYGLEE